ncbi:alpha-L-fucosidase [Faecalimonas sp. LCP19S3_D12]
MKEIDRVIAEGPYDADWNSLFQFTVPDWFSKEKFGIFIHWGLYSIAAHNNKWYSRNMYIQDKEEWEYHRKTFGEHTKFGYKDFIQMFHAEKFDPKQWAKLFKAAGAKYVFPVAEHHDGFQMYKSEISKYNAFDMSPKRDLLGELREAIEEENLMFGSGIVEVERGALADPKPFVWQTDTAIAKNSWCYTDTLEYKTSRQIICNFIEIISKNGNMLLNVGPKGDGEIPEEDQNVLLGSGLTAGLSTEGTVPMSFTGTYIGMFAENGSSAFQEFQVNYVLPDE